MRDSKPALYAIIAIGVCLRVALAWRTAPFDAYDNHFEPIYLLLAQRAIPDKFACFQCYHPPVFYVVQAVFAWLLTNVGVRGPVALKALQYMNCAFGIGGFLLLLAIIDKVPVPRAARLGSAAILAVLPRHIYMSAAHSNDALAILLVTATVWMFLRLGDGRAGWGVYLGMAATACLAAFTKYNALAMIPAMAVGFGALPALRDSLWRRRVLARAATSISIPTAVVALAMYSNFTAYGSILPGNDGYSQRTAGASDLLARQPRDSPSADFVRFEPWKVVDEPLLRPGGLSQFWTLMHASTWFDNDAKFVQYLGNDDWVDAYYRWLRGEGSFPQLEPGAAVRRAEMIGRGLNALGLGVLAIGVIGVVALMRMARPNTAEGGRWRALAAMFLTLATANVIGIMYWVHRVPVYSAMKGTYLLPSIATLGVVLALGLGRFEEAGRGRWAARGLVTAAVLLSCLHVGQIVLS